MNKEKLKNTYKHVLDIERQEIERLIENTNYDEVFKLAEEIKKRKGKIVVTGCGTSAAAAKKIVHSFNCVNITAIYMNPSDAIHGALGVIDEDDITIVISKGGNTKELTGLLPSIKAQGSLIVGVGENVDSTIGKVSDIFMKIEISKEPDPFNMLATASTMAVIASFDALIIYLMEETEFTKEQFGINHPSGAVGERLLKNESL